MKVLVLGAGHMGSAFVQQLHAAGHAVSVTARDAARPAALAAAHAGVRAVAPQGAAQGQDLIVLAVPYAEAVPALRSLGDIAGRVVLDISNPLTPDYMGLTIGHDTSAAEEIARAVPQAVVVKGFNTVFAQVLAAGPDFGNGRRASAFIASDSAPAKQAVNELARSLGYEVVDAGGLKNARYLEPLAGLNIYLGYGAGLGTGIAPAWIHRA